MIDSIGPTVGEERRRESLFTREFVLVCLISLASYTGFQFLLPTLPLYMKSLGGQDSEIGLILGIYSVSVLAARFIAGRAIDGWGRRWLLMVGALLYLIAMLLYNVTTTVQSILLLRLFHGLGFGLVTTAAWALAAELAPPSRRGEALGYFGNFSSVAMALGPGIALWLISAEGFPLSGFPLLFAACALVGALGLALTFLVGESRRSPQGQPASTKTRAVDGLFSRAAVPFAIAMFFGAFATGAILSFVPIHLSTESTQNVPVFFFVYALSMTVSRPFIGMASDRIDRRAVPAPLMAVCAAGVAILALSPGLPAAVVSAIVCGVGFGSLQPTLLVLVVEATDARERGAALATFMSSVDVGIAVGSTALGMVAQVAGYRWVFLIACGMVLLGLLYFLIYQRFLASQPAVPKVEARPTALSD